ncbi:hypothetical protein C2845_PM07G22810 [Panicum miliaceum]|uniref:Uncharacterized protein n=1 Tax=Panicum miliaceum TaxID=4540 RepID=A0A3L6SJN7_PANMI|nr:hypothetical protein C2845_PM07G22810 [Panicum miliaceum]
MDFMPSPFPAPHHQKLPSSVPFSRGGAPPCHRRSLTPTPRDLGFPRPGAAPPSRPGEASTSSRRRSHPLGAPGAAPSSRRGFVLLRSSTPQPPRDATLLPARPAAAPSSSRGPPSSGMRTAAAILGLEACSPSPEL